MRVREKKEYVIFTFHTTAAAMATEKLCQERSIPGRLIPAPRSITADCGMAWRCEPSLRQQVVPLADPNEVMGIYELEI